MAVNNRDLACAIGFLLDRDAPLDVTLKTLESGQRVTLGKDMRRDLPFVYFYGTLVVGAADPVWRGGNDVWLSPIRLLTDRERASAASTPTTPVRGGWYLL